MGEPEAQASPGWRDVREGTYICVDGVYVIWEC